MRLVIDHLIPARKFTESSRVKLVEIPSPRLTEFYGRPMSLRAGVVLPGFWDPRRRPERPDLSRIQSIRFLTDVDNRELREVLP